jgi:hypothetical protein
MVQLPVPDYSNPKTPAQIDFQAGFSSAYSHQLSSVSIQKKKDVCFLESDAVVDQLGRKKNKQTSATVVCG